MKGFIFRCNNRTQDEVFARSLFGDESMYLPLVRQITQEDVLFLYNLSTYKFSGPYAPKGLGGAHIVPSAWKSKFPAQIHFSSLPVTKTVPFKLVEKVIKVYHKGMYPDMELDEEQTNAILKLLR